MPKLTKKFVDNIQVESGEDITFFDTEVYGFGVRCRGGKVKTYTFMYRDSKKKQKKMKIGVHGNITVEQARQHAQMLSAKITLGKDPHEEKKQRQKIEEELPTVDSLAKEYLRLHAKPNKSPKGFREDRDMLEKYILPVFGKYALQDLEAV